jgi:hypothetical protein
MAQRAITDIGCLRLFRPRREPSSGVGRAPAASVGSSGSSAVPSVAARSQQ